MEIEVNVNVDEEINDFVEEIIELTSIIERGEFDFASFENSDTDKEIPIFRLILAAYNAGRSIN